MLSRRELLKRTALLTGMVGTGFLADSSPVKSTAKLKIGACDWSIGKRSDIGAFALAREIGLQGVQVDVGSEGEGFRLRQKARQEAYLAESKRTGVRIASLALGALNQIPYKSEPRTEEWVWDAVDIADNLDVRVILLAFFSKNDLRGDEAGMKEVIRRLKMVAPKAEKKKVILGIESYLSAEAHMDIIQKVGSESVKVFYDFRNSADAGYDVIKEIKWLGRDAICEIHMKEKNVLLGKGTMDWQRISDTLAEMNYYGDGWMQIESASPKDMNIVDSYKHNHAFLQQLFARN